MTESPEKALLDEPTKENLITIIANMHNVSEWYGHGFTQEEEKFLTEVGRAAIKFCGKEGTWDLPLSTEEQ